MLASINPLGERARNTRWGRTVSWYLAGSLAGGVAVGAAAGGLGAALRLVAAPSALVVGRAALGAAAVGLALDLHLGGLPVPTVRRQVNEDWLARYRGWVYGSGFGFQLGLGVVTIVTTSTVYLALALAVLAGSVPAGILIGATFGLVRAAPILAMARADNPARVRAVLRRAHDTARPAKALALGCLVILTAASLAAVLL